MSCVMLSQALLLYSPASAVMSAGNSIKLLLRPRLIDGCLHTRTWQFRHSNNQVDARVTERKGGVGTRLNEISHQ